MFRAMMATLNPLWIHFLAHAAPIPGPNPKTAQTFEFDVISKIKTLQTQWKVTRTKGNEICGNVYFIESEAMQQIPTNNLLS